MLGRTDLAPFAIFTNAFYHADGNGNITSVLSSSQSVAARYRYDPFGNTISQSGLLADPNVYRFSSKEIHTKSGMYYYGARFYDPNLQRWVIRDPIGELGGLNLYGYVYNDPVTETDPFGLIACETPDPECAAAKAALAEFMQNFPNPFRSAALTEQWVRLVANVVSACKPKSPPPRPAPKKYPYRYPPGPPPPYWYPSSSLQRRSIFAGPVTPALTFCIGSATVAGGAAALYLYPPTRPVFTLVK